MLTQEDKDNLDKWNEAKRNKDFALADVYRAKLIERKII